MRVTRLHGTLGPWVVAVHVATLNDYTETVALGVPLHRGRNLRKTVVGHGVGRVFNIPNSHSAVGAVRSQSIFCSSMPLACHDFLGVPTEFRVEVLNMLCDTSFRNYP